MLAMVRATYPPHVVKAVIDAYTSPEIPKRPDYAKEIASFVYGDNDGYHTVIILEVENSRLADYVNAQIARNVYLQSRVEGLKVEVHMGQSVMEAIPLAAKQLPQR